MKNDRYLYKAGRILIVMAWFNLALAVVIGALWYNLDSNMPGSEIMTNQYMLVLSISIPASILSLVVGKALKHNKTWTKIPALLLTLLAFVSVPVGTIIAIFIIYYLYKGWSEFELPN